MNYFTGKKTYISAALLGLTTVAWALGVVDDDTAKVLFGLFGGAGFVSLGLKVERLSKEK